GPRRPADPTRPGPPRPARRPGGRALRRGRQRARTGDIPPGRLHPQGDPRHVFTRGSRPRGRMTGMSDTSSPARRPTTEGRPAVARAGDVTISSSSPAATNELRPRAANGRFVRVSSHEEPRAPDLPVDRYLDRELSWLQFNERVLQLAADDTVPLLERARFLAIFTSNLDEFFMVRVAGLKRRIATGIAVRSPSGLEPREVLEQIADNAHDLTLRQARAFEDSIRPALADEGITIVHWDEVDPAEQER